jgi:hypothetical protein
VNRQITTTSDLVLMTELISSKLPAAFPITRVSGIANGRERLPITGRMDLEERPAGFEERLQRMVEDYEG